MYRQCDKCGYFTNQFICPACGYEFPEEVDEDYEM